MGKANGLTAALNIIGCVQAILKIPDFRFLHIDNFLLVSNGYFLKFFSRSEGQKE